MSDARRLAEAIRQAVAQRDSRYLALALENAMTEFLTQTPSPFYGSGIQDSKGNWIFQDPGYTKPEPVGDQVQVLLTEANLREQEILRLRGELRRKDEIIDGYDQACDKLHQKIAALTFQIRTLTAR